MYQVHCDNGDEEEKIIITSCFRESDLTMPRYKTVKRLTKRVKGVREEDSARLQRGMRCFLRGVRREGLEEDIEEVSEIRK